LSGGSEKFINGVFFSGQLSLYHTDAEILNSKIEGSSSDDGLNVKYGKVRIENSLFANNKADQADLDFCDGTVNNSVFRSLLPNEGDGLDVSGSNILVLDSAFEGLGDKGISIGEQSWVVVYNSLVVDNGMGSAVKDLSEAFFLENTFAKNKTAIAAYEKKPLFGGASFYLFENRLEENESKFSLDEKSSQGSVDLSGKEAAFREAIASRNIEGLKEILKGEGQ